MISSLAIACILSFLSSFFVNGTCRPNAQQVLQKESDAPGGPFVRRFTVDSIRETEELLRWAQEKDWDVWQASDTHVDVYFSQRSHSTHPSLHTYTDSPIETYNSLPLSENSMYAEGRLPQDWNLPSLSNSTYHASYHTLDDIYSFLRDLAAVYPDKVKIVPLGRTGESRELYALEIGSSNTKSHDPNGETVISSTNEKLSFLITGTQHAREWVASAAALYLAHALAANASEPNSLTHLLDDYNFYIIAVPNPDGYVYTWEHDRFWYKNRLYLGPHAQCVGLDMNRNWGYKFKSGSVKVAPSSAKPQDSCSHWYPGHRPFQAPEVNNIALYIESLPTFDAFVDLRSYGQMLSAPYSYSCKKSPKDAEDQLEAASGAAYAVRKFHKTIFTTGTLCSTLYRAPGNIVDWMYATMGVKYSYAAHLRDTGTYGFALPPQWIRPVGEETAKIVEYLARFIAKKQKKIL